MTLEAYEPEQLDALALRVLDVAAVLRRMAGRCRAEQVHQFPLNDRKALEWLAKIEQWAGKAEADLGLTIARARGARKAAEVAARLKDS